MTPFDQLPKPILDKLRSMIRRVRRLIFLRGLFATLAVGLVCLLAVMAVDAALTLLSSASRWGISLAGLAATLAAAWWFLLRPLSRRLTIERMARILEIRHPELQERISTAVELLASDDPDSIRGSQELIAAVVDSAVGDIATVDPKTEFRPGRSKRFMAIAAAGAGVLALLLAVWPQQSWTLLKRAFAPHRDIGNAYAAALVVEPGDLRVARGEAVSIEVSVKHRRLDRAEVRRRLPDGTDSVERMTLVSEAPDGTRRFSLSFPSVEEAFAYRVRAGGAVSRYFDVAVVDPPAVERLTIRYDFPDYTGLPDAESASEAGGTGEIRALAHTRVTVVAAFDKPVAKADLRFGEGAPLPEPVVEGQRATWRFELVPAMRGSWQLDLADPEGFVNRPATYPAEVLPDRAPAVRMLAPAQREIRVKPTEILPLDLAIDEDFGIADLVLLATPVGASSAVERPQPQPVATDRSGQFAGRALLEIPALGLTPEQRRISVQARVRDNRPARFGGPGVGLSDIIVVVLDENAKSLADQAIEAQRQEIEQQMREAKQELERARDDLRRGEQELIRDKDFTSSARERLEEFTRHNDAAREKLGQIAATLDTPLFQEQSRQASQLADEALAAAQEKADTIPMTDAQHQRVAESQEVRAKVEEAIQGLDQLAKSMREANRDYAAIAKLNQLADRQRQLASQAREWTQRSEQEQAAAREAAQQAADQNARRQAMEQFDQRQRQEAEQFRNEQSQVEQQLGEMLKDNAAALAEILEQQRARSDALAAEAETLAQRQQALREASRDATERSEATSQDVLREALEEQLAQLQTEAADGEGTDQARRQEAIAEQIEAVKEGRLQEALARMESLLESDAAALEAQARGMETSLRNLRQSQPTARAREAAQSLDRGEQRAAASSRQLAAAQEQQATAEEKGELADGELAKQARTTMRQAQAEQQQSAQALVQAAQAFARSSEAIGQTIDGLDPSDMDQRLASSEDLAQGFEDVAKSSQSQSAPEAAEQSQQAADSLQQLAQSAMQQLGKQPNAPAAPQPGQDLASEPGDTALNETGQKTADWDSSGIPPELSRLGISAADWARFKGAIAGGSATAIETELPAEYRELVGRYFQVIAKEAGKGQ